jgi:hypothetical protein
MTASERIPAFAQIAPNELARPLITPVELVSLATASSILGGDSRLWFILG